MTTPDLGTVPYGADGRARVKLETYERTLPDGTVRTIPLNPRDPDECWFCDAKPPTHVFTGKPVVMNLKDTFLGWGMGNPDLLAEVFEPGDWMVCTPCFELIQADKWGKLNLRVLELTAAQPGEEGAAGRAALRNRKMRRVSAEWLAIRAALVLPGRPL
jgi:hypothetical protein